MPAARRRLEQMDTPEGPPLQGTSTLGQQIPPVINWLDLSRVCPALPDRVRAWQTELYVRLTAPLWRRFVGSAYTQNQHCYYFIFLAEGFRAKT